MASMRDIKRRKESVQSTGQITKAMKLVSSVKLQKAKELLKNTSLSIGEVCIESGFESHSYFSMLFKRSNGCTPSEYRSAESKGKRE